MVCTPRPQGRAALRAVAAPALTPVWPVTSVVEMGKENEESAVPENESVDVERIIALRKRGSDQVREMTA